MATKGKRFAVLITLGLSLIQLALLSDLQAALGEKQPTLPKLDVVYNHKQIGRAHV